MEHGDLLGGVERLKAFLGRKPLTTAIAELEGQLNGASSADLSRIVGNSGVDPSLLEAAVTVRRNLGRVNDLIHATAIVLLLPQVLVAGESVTNRPSLASGNDPSRPFDLETNLRVAEFKLSRWTGADAMRKRQTFKDLVHLAADPSDRKAQLFIVGDAPIRFLRTSRSKAAWALDRSPRTASLFESQFGSLDLPIKEFTTGLAHHVEIVDIGELLPEAVVRSEL